MSNPTPTDPTPAGPFEPAQEPAPTNSDDPGAARPQEPLHPQEAPRSDGQPPRSEGAPAPRANPVIDDETYGALRDENRVVMRHSIALNLDTFRAASPEFAPRPTQDFPPLQEPRPPFFSVVIANHNGRHHLPVVLAALQRQTFADFETLVADDASTDDSVAWVEQQHPTVRLVVNRRNLGFAATCNTGAAAASGRFLVMLNSDTEPEPTWLEALAQAIVAHPEAAAFASKLLLFDRREQLHTAGDLLGRDGLARNRGAWEQDLGQFDAETYVFSACGGAAAYRREVWDALGGYDETFWMYLEDVDYGFRARLAGWETVFVPQARVYHRLSASGGDILASYYVGRNAIWLIAKNMPSGLLRRNGSRIVAAQARIAWDALRALRGQAARARLRGQVAGLLGLPQQWAGRKAIQQRSSVPESVIEQALDSRA